MVGVRSAILQHGADAPGYPLILYKVELRTYKDLIFQNLSETRREAHFIPPAQAP